MMLSLCPSFIDWVAVRTTTCHCALIVVGLCQSIVIYPAVLSTSSIIMLVAGISYIPAASIEDHLSFLLTDGIDDVVYQMF